MKCLKCYLLNASLAIFCWALCASNSFAGIITVLNLGDGLGIGTLRTAVSNAAPGDTIAFSTLLDGSAIILTSGAITIDKPLTIMGNGSAKTIITANSFSRVFLVQDASEVLISGVAILNGNAEIGGGLFCENTNLTLRSCLVTGSNASGDASNQGGGGIANSGGALLIENSIISNNTASGSAGSGGGILNIEGGTLFIQNTEISGNSASRAGGGIEHNAGTTLVTLVNVTLRENQTGSAPGNGGGLHITGSGNCRIEGGMVIGNTASAEGGGLWNGSGNMLIDSVSIFSNIASGAGADQGGGGIYNLSGELTIINKTQISNNICDGTSGSGGGILNDTGGTLTITDAVITANIASRAGGGIEDNSGSATLVTLTNVTLSKNETGSNPGNGGGLHVTGSGEIMIQGGLVSENTASAEGGGLWNGTGLMICDSVEIIANVASGDAPDQGGGGIYNLSGMLQLKNKTKIAGNTANGSAGSGGGILNDVGGTLLITDVVIEGNSCVRAGGGIEDVSGAATTIEITNTTISANTAGPSPGNGGGLHITGAGNVQIKAGLVTQNQASAEGGGLWNGTGTMTIEGTVVSENTASGDSADNGGGGVFNAGGTVAISADALIINNTADGMAGSGGGIFNDAGGNLTIADAVISGNIASRAGGGIEDNSGAATTIILTDVSLSGNFTGNAPGNGGGLHITGAGDATLTGCLVISNTAASQGGGLWNGTGTMSVVEVTIDGNETTGSPSNNGGAGVYNHGGTLEFAFCTISDNSVSGNGGVGGGVYNNLSGMASLNNCTVSGNQTMGMGGAISNDGTLEITASTIAYNSAMANGGGIAHLNSDAQTSLSSTIVATNSSQTQGQDIAGEGMFESRGYNMIGNDDQNLFSRESNDQVGDSDNAMNPNLDSLADNGGKTKTHALICPSSAIDNGDPNNMGPDQNGRNVFNGRRDIGSYEYQDSCAIVSTLTAKKELEGSKLFPNPSYGGDLTLEIPAGYGEVLIQVFDLRGYLVFQKSSASGQIPLQVNQLSSGNYFVRVWSEAGTAVHKLEFFR